MRTPMGFTASVALVLTAGPLTSLGLSFNEHNATKIRFTPDESKEVQTYLDDMFSKEDIESIHKALKTGAGSTRKPVLLIVGTAPMWEFAENLLCSLDVAGFEANQTVLVGLGPNFCDYVSAGGQACVELGSINRSSAESAAKTYGTKAYEDLMKQKLGVVTIAVLSNLTKGILYADLDVTFLRNPLQALMHAPAGDAAFLFDSPLIKDASSCNDFDSQHWEDKSWLKYLSGGLYYIRSSPGGVKLIQRAFKNLREGKVGRDGSDQGALQIAAADMVATKEAVVRRFACDVFVNGNVFWGHRSTFRIWNTVAVHASWMVGTKLKQKCLQAGGLWLLSDSNHCIRRPMDLDMWIERTANVTAEMHPRGGRVVDC